MVTISELKIRYLGGRIARWLAARDDLELGAGEDTLAAMVARVFRDDQERERALDAEVDRMMVQVRRQIETQRLDAGMLRQKIRKQLAKERGFVL